MICTCPKCKRLVNDDSFHFCFSSIQEQMMKAFDNSCIVCGVVSDLLYIHNNFPYCDEHYVDIKNRINETNRYFELDALRNL